MVSILCIVLIHMGWECVVVNLTDAYDAYGLGMSGGGR